VAGREMLGSSMHQPPLMLPQWHSFLFRVCSLSLRFCQEPVAQGSSVYLCRAVASNSLRYWDTSIHIEQYESTINSPSASA
jgi:hypothetical protein